MKCELAGCTISWNTVHCFRDPVIPLIRRVMTNNIAISSHIGTAFLSFFDSKSCMLNDQDSIFRLIMSHFVACRKLTGGDRWHTHMFFITVTYMFPFHQHSSSISDCELKLCWATNSDLRMIRLSMDPFEHVSGTFMFHCFDMVLVRTKLIRCFNPTRVSGFVWFEVDSASSKIARDSCNNFITVSPPLL